MLYSAEELSKLSINYNISIDIGHIRRFSDISVELFYKINAETRYSKSKGSYSIIVYIGSDTLTSQRYMLNSCWYNEPSSNPPLSSRAISKCFNIYYLMRFINCGLYI